MRFFKNFVAFATLMAVASIILAACVVGNGEIPEPPYTPSCRAYPDEPEKCGLPWSGQVVQVCNAGGSFITSLQYDRPGVVDSLPANLMVLGNDRFDRLNWAGSFRDTVMVCDNGACREYSVKFKPYSIPIRGGTGILQFWEADSSFDAASGAAYEGQIQLDTAVIEPCS